MKAFKKLPINKTTYIIAVVAFIIVGIIPSFYFYNQYKTSQKLLQNPNQAAKQEIKSLVEKVGKLMVLPKGEDPTVATVTDKTKLAGQAFFQNAENGDKVLIYGNAQKVFLYRSSINKIINVGPINTGGETNANPANSPAPITSKVSPSQGPTSTPTPTPKQLRTVLLNGTSTIGLTNTVEKDLKAKIANITVVDKDNAIKKPYSDTLVIDLTGSQSDAAGSIAKIMKGKTASLPDGETKPKDTDIVIIIGSSYLK